MGNLNLILERKFVNQYQLRGKKTNKPESKGGKKSKEKEGKAIVLWPFSLFLPLVRN